MSLLRGGVGLALVLLASCDQPDPNGVAADLLARGPTVFVAPGGHGNGSSNSPFGDIQAAVDAAAEAGGGTVRVLPGNYVITDAITILDSHITLQGSGRPLCVPDLDHPDVGAVPCQHDDDGTERRGLHPNGEMLGSTATRIEAEAGPFEGDDPPNANMRPMIAVGCGGMWRWVDDCPDVVLEDVRISGLTLARAPDERAAIQIWRVDDFEVKGNVVEGAPFGVFTTGSTGRIVGNNVSNIDACGLCINAPLPGHGDTGDGPPDVDIVANTMDGATAAVFLFGASSGIRQQGNHLHADLQGNAFRNAALGARMSPSIRPAGSPGFGQVDGNITAHFTGNEYSGNNLAYLFDDGFGFRRDNTGPGPFDHDTEGPSPCAPRWYTGTFDITLNDEQVDDTNGPSEITFTRPIGSGWENWQYLHYATYTIWDPDNVLHAAEPIGDPLRAGIYNPTYDPYQDLTPDAAPYIDACATERVYDLIGEPAAHPGTPQTSTPTALDQDLGNTLVINGVVMPHLQGSEGGVDCTGPELSDCMRACIDGRDNDGDGLLDWDDPDCAPECNTETLIGDGLDGADNYTAIFGASGALSTQVHGLAAAQTQPGAVGQDEWVDHYVNVPAGTVYVRFATYDEYTDQPHVYDIDLYVYDPHDALINIGYTATATERVDVLNPEPGTYLAQINGYWTAGTIAQYTLFSYVVGPDEGNLTVTGPANVTAGVPVSLTADWTGLATCTKYVGVVDHFVDGTLQSCLGETVEIATDNDPSCF